MTSDPEWRLSVDEQIHLLLQLLAKFELFGEQLFQGSFSLILNSTLTRATTSNKPEPFLSEPYQHLFDTTDFLYRWSAGKIAEPKYLFLKRLCCAFPLSPTGSLISEALVAHLKMFAAATQPGLERLIRASGYLSSLQLSRSLSSTVILKSCFLVEKTKPISLCLNAPVYRTRMSRIDLLKKVAHFLLNLHSDNFRIRHGALSLQSICLDEKETLRIGNYSFVKSFDDPCSFRPAPKLIGTCLPPEYGKLSNASPFTDIYFFGVLAWLLFLSEDMRHSVESVILQPSFDITKHKLSDGVGIIDQSRIDPNFGFIEKARRLITELVSKCTHTMMDSRPDAKQVLKFIRRIERAQTPADPAIKQFVNLHSGMLRFRSR